VEVLENFRFTGTEIVEGSVSCGTLNFLIIFGAGIKHSKRM
jgi:hypothetical protein